MISKGHTKTKEEMNWLDVVVEFAAESDFLIKKYGHVISESWNFEIDHILGAKTKRKINGVSCRVGELAIMPIPYSLHNVMSKNPVNRTTNPGNYRYAFGHEKKVWLEMIRVMQGEGYEIPFNEEVIQAIIK
tara:strand:- start:536 stop:931 length:396 start_codon:yes stop_codon:yes gene_type:complete